MKEGHCYTAPDCSLWVSLNFNNYFELLPKVSSTFKCHLSERNVLIIVDLLTDAHCLHTSAIKVPEQTYKARLQSHGTPLS